MLTLLAFLTGLAAAAQEPAGWVPTGLPPIKKDPQYSAIGGLGNYLTPEQGKAVLDQATARFSNPVLWRAYAELLRRRIQQAAGLSPWPKRTPLNPIIRERRVCDGYTVENVAFESVPGYFVTGNLYRPLTPGRHPAILSTHRHAKPITKPVDYDHYARFAPGMQQRCASLARMGAVVLAVDMFGMGDSILEVGQEAHAHPFSMTIQLWDNIRALDFLESLPDVDPKRLAATGESGGATQILFLTALDQRVTVSVPVVMVSSFFFGGCACESGLPVHHGSDYFASNAMVAALAAPRPMLVVTDGGDWTRYAPDVEYPFIQKIYSYFGAEKDVANVHLPLEKHNFGPSKRAAMYLFMAQRLHLDLAQIQSATSPIDESHTTIEPASALHVFDLVYPLPEGALRTAAAVEAELNALKLKTLVSD